MKKRHMYYCLLLALLVTGLYNIFMPRSAFYTEQHLKLGQIVEKDIIAPFDFPFLKTKQELDKEKAEITRTLKPVYVFSDEVQFNAIKAINKLFIPLIERAETIDTIRVESIFRSEGVILSDKSAVQLQNINTSKNLYNYLIKELDVLYKKGIYANLSQDTINVVMNGEIIEVSISTLLSNEEAIDIVLNNASGSSYKSVLEEMLPELIMPSLIEDKKLFNDLVEQRAA